jgi:hypothetical protein
MLKLSAAVAASLLMVGAAAAETSSRAYDADGWRADARQVRDAFSTRYANLDWALNVREAELDRAFKGVEAKLGTLSSDAEARELFDTFSRWLGDGHVRFEWPTIQTASGAETAARKPCESLGASGGKPSNGVAAAIPGYQPAGGPDAAFPAGLLAVGEDKLGVIRIGQFGLAQAPALCASAAEALKLSPTEPCDETCRDRLYAAASTRMTEAFIAQLRALKEAGATVLLVDLTGNGGGDDWTEAAVRMVTPVRLTSARVAFVRGEHWRAQFERQAEELRAAAARAKGDDRKLLLTLAATAQARAAEAAKPCAPSAALKGQACSPTAPGDFATGPLASADPAALKGKPWAADVFTPMLYPYEEGVWKGPLLVLVDEKTASASEEFAAELQDNRAAIVVGAPTFGSGCGHTAGGWPVTLGHSGAILRLPDCARLRANGENEVAGIHPDVLTGFHDNEGPRRRAARLPALLPAAIVQAKTQAASR